MSGGEMQSVGGDVVIGIDNGLTFVHDPSGALTHVLDDDHAEPEHQPRAQLFADVAATATSLAAVHANAGEFVRLSPHSVELLRQFGAVPTDSGFFHAFVRGSGGQIAGQLQWQPVATASQQALSLQLAVATLALRLAIGNLEHAVERVEEQVELVRAFLAAQQVGDVVGNYVVVRDVVERIARGVTLAQADWDAVAGVGAACQRDVQRLRAWITKRTVMTRRRRSAASDAIAELREPLALLTIAEQTQLLWHAIKLEQIRLREPDRLDATIDEAHTTLRTQRDLDITLRSDLADFVLARSRSPRIDGLIPGRYRSAREVWKAGTDLVDWFTRERALEPLPIAPPYDWTAGEVVDELRDRAADTAHAARQKLPHSPAAEDRPDELTRHEDDRH